jgi:hypothetical protein
MKLKVIIAGLTTLAAAVTTYVFLKGRRHQKSEPVQKMHHLTSVFSKAKAYAK